MGSGFKPNGFAVIANFIKIIKSKQLGSLVGYSIPFCKIQFLFNMVLIYVVTINVHKHCLPYRQQQVLTGELIIGGTSINSSGYM